MAINDVLRDRRLKLGLSQEDLADELGISIDSYGDLEDHSDEFETVPGLRHVKQLARILRFDLLEVLGTECPFCHSDRTPQAEFSWPRWKLLVWARLQRGLSIAEVANQTGSDAELVRLLESSVRSLEDYSVADVRDFARVLDLPLQLLIRWRCARCGK